MCNDILYAREDRTKKVVQLAKQGKVITVHANVAGANKNLPEAHLLVRYFAGQVVGGFGGNCQFWQGADGPCAVITDSSIQKSDTVKLEEHDLLGRFVDIDVFEQGQTNSCSRGHMRKCYLCNKPAFVCGREGNHTSEELQNALKNAVRMRFSDILSDVLKSSFMAELNLENKFGLVTPTSNGSHSDMDYALMQRAQDAIIPFIVTMFWQGVDTPTENLLSVVRQTGILAEKAMLKVTDGANAYKGLIFVMGIVVSSLGNTICGGSLTTTIKTMCKGLTGELTCKNLVTNGANAFNLYGIAGARGEAQNGFPAVMLASQKLKTENNLLKVLAYIVGVIDDTVLLKRCGSLQKYNYFKQAISTLNVDDTEKLLQLNRECIANNISIGGSADILATAVAYNRLSVILFGGEPN